MEKKENLYETHVTCDTFGKTYNIKLSHGNNFIGLLVAYQESGKPYIFLESIFVNSHYRGQGLSHRLMKTFLHHFGAKETRLIVAPFQDGTLTIPELKVFYAKYHFRPMNQSNWLKRKP